METSTERDEAESSSSNGHASLHENEGQIHELVESGQIEEEDTPLKPKARTIKNYYSIGITSLVLVALMTLLQSKDTVSVGATTAVFGSLKVVTEAPRKGLVYAQQQWSSASHSFQPNISDWDAQRAALFRKHPKLKPRPGERPRILMVTGSSPKPSESPILSHLLIRAGKNKLDYCTMHGLRLIYHIFGEDPEFNDEWAKLPVIRMLMLQHPEVEWIWWIDADTIFTNMSSTPPVAELEYHNLVLNGEDGLVYDKWDRAGLSTGAYLIRNCQWSLDLLGAWAYGAGQTTQSRDLERVEDKEGDLSSLVTLLEEDKRNPVDQQRWVSRVKLVMDNEAAISEELTTGSPNSKELTLERIPSVTHVSGCLPSNPGNSTLSSANIDTCVKRLQRAMDHADRQMLEQFKIQPIELSDFFEQPAPTGTVSGTAQAKDSSAFKFQPAVVDWDKKRQAYITAKRAANANAKPKRYHHRVLLAGGTGPQPCSSTVGGSLLLRIFKNWVDYGRVQGFKSFYNMAPIDTNFTGSWSKIPLIRKLMVNNPEVEWIWWIDDDAVFTSMDFRVPFETYDASGHNFVMWGDKNEIFYQRRYNGVNTGNFLIRNCQWSLDLLDRWGSFGASQDRQMRANAVMTTVLEGPPGWVPDDQTAMVYLLITERLNWASKVHFEQVIVMSGDWAHWTKLYLDQFDLSPEDRPLVTHFTGCQFCAEALGDNECLQGMLRTLNFADNQLLQYYGLRHVSLNSTSITKRSVGDVQVQTASEIERYVRNGGKMNLTSAEDEQMKNSTPERGLPTDESLVRMEGDLEDDEDELDDTAEELEDPPTIPARVEGRPAAVSNSSVKLPVDNKELRRTTAPVAPNLGTSQVKV